MLSSPLRFTRLSIALVATAACTIAALAALALTAGTAGSADPPCNGSKLCLDMTRTNPLSGFGYVTRGGYLTYDVTIRSAGTATATKTKLRLDLPPGATLPPDSLLDPRCAQATVAGTFGITCNLGSVKPSDTPLHFTFNIKLGATVATTVPAVTTASLSYDARASDTGNAGKDPTVETIVLTDAIEVRNNDGESSSGVPQGITVSLDTDPTGKGPDANNKATAKFTLFASNFVTTAKINDQVQDQTFVCPQGLKCPTAGWTDATIPHLFASLNDIFKVELDYHSSVVPKGLTEKGYVMLHVNNAGLQTEISEHCSANPSPPCLLDVDLKKNGDLTAVALVEGNHRFR